MFKVDFVGVVCLHPEGDVVWALIPDGRTAKPAHIARLIVDPDQILEGEESWGPRDPDDVERGEFILPPGPLEIEGADRRGEIRIEGFHDRLPSLRRLAPEFIVDRSGPRVWTSIAVQQGTFEAFRWPGSRDKPTVSVLTQVTIPYAENYRISVTSTRKRIKDANPYLVLRAGTNVVIINDSTSPTNKNPHFHIYNCLDRDFRPLLGQHPPPTPRGIPPLQTRHHYYNRPSSGDDQCPNTQSGF